MKLATSSRFDQQKHLTIISSGYKTMVKHVYESVTIIACIIMIDMTYKNADCFLL